MKRDLWNTLPKYIVYLNDCGSTRTTNISVNTSIYLGILFH